MKKASSNIIFVSDLASPIGEAKNFFWHEALWCPQWQVYALPNDIKIVDNIVQTALKMQHIRNLLQKPITVTSWYRPELYNQLIGGSKKSAHMQGLACDFQIKGMPAQKVRDVLKFKLKDLNIRMEDLSDANWVHIDLRCEADMSNEKRFFKP
jgi:hypothetical protein